jgi:hypothetical protein
MSEFLATAERLRVVKSAFQDFIQLWAIDQLMETHTGADRIIGDLHEVEENNAIPDFSCLYRGVGLDD